MKKYSLSALAAAGLLAGGLATSANAADLGGNCCADLEERIAELEATTARKGNRKVSLTISGWVAEQVTYWDDGFEQNMYVTGLGTTLASNFKLSGQATIAPGWTAGYLLHIEADGSDALTTSQNTPRGPGLISGTSPFIQTLQSFWFIKSESLGKVSVGLQSAASDNAAILVDGSGSLVPANWVAFDVLSFAIRRGNGTSTGSWGIAGACIPGDCFGVPANSVRYDSPTYAGFSMSATWGDDDFWDVGGRYAGEIAGFKVAGTVVYAESAGATSIFGNDVEYLQAGAYVQHIASGIFGLVNYGNIDGAIVPAGYDPTTWYFKAGLRQRWTPLGHTVLYGEYMTSDDTIAAATTGSEFEWYGAGIVQEIDNAAMSLWLKYRQYSFENAGICGATGCEELDEITFGGLINF